MISQMLTVTVHNPRVESVQRISKEPDGPLVVTLGNGEYHGHVTLLVSDADWNAIGMAVSEFLDGETLQGADLRDADLQTGYISTTDYGYEGGSDGA